MELLEIRGELIKHGSNLNALARELGVTPSAVRFTAERRTPSKRVAQAISDKINQPLEVVFPEYLNK